MITQYFHDIWIGEHFFLPVRDGDGIERFIKRSFNKAQSLHDNRLEHLRNDVVVIVNDVSLFNDED